MVNIKAANIQKTFRILPKAESYVSAVAEGCNGWLEISFFAITTKLLSLFGSYGVKLIRLNKERTQ